MANKKFLLGILIFILGLTGVLSLLTMDIPIPEEAREALELQFTPAQIKWLVLVNPTFMLLIATVIGTVLYDKAGLPLPFFEKIVGKEVSTPTSGIVKYGLIGGIAAGLLITIIAAIFQSKLPAEFIELGEKVKPTVLNRFLYGGITEEILMRFGLMTFFAWLLSKLIGKLNAAVYWIAILFSSLLFAAGHLPIAFQAVGTPSTLLIAYILIGNSVGGIIFGWLYWKKGLSSAMLAHMGTHVILLTIAPLFA